MALQELSKKEMSALMAGATAARTIMARVAKDDPDELPIDEIRQFEIAALYHTEVMKDVIALGLKRRLEDGATVQPGPYYLEPDTGTMEDLEENLLDYQGGEFNCIGFNGVGFSDPSEPVTAPESKPEPVTESKPALKRNARAIERLAGLLRNDNTGGLLLASLNAHLDFWEKSVGRNPVKRGKQK